jgi:hypothetical protein
MDPFISTQMAVLTAAVGRATNLQPPSTTFKTLPEATPGSRSHFNKKRDILQAMGANMIKTRRLFRWGSGLLVALAVFAGPMSSRAAAEPAPFETLVMTCDDLGEIATVSPGGGLFTPGFVRGTHQLLVIWSIHVTIYVDDVQDAVLAKTRGASPPAASLGCTFDQTYHFGDHSYRVVGATTVIPVGES